MLEKVDTLVLDKTGTLTEGKPHLERVIATAGQSEAEVLRLAASLEKGSEHPLAEAIVQGAEGRGVQVTAATGGVGSRRLDIEIRYRVRVTNTFYNLVYPFYTREEGA